MKQYCGPDFFTNNRTKLREQVDGNAPIIITGNGVMQRDSDEGQAFNQEANFWYLTGLSNPDLTLVMTSTDTFVIVPARSFVHEMFNGSHNLANYAATSGIDTYLPEHEGWQRVRSELAKHRTVATLASSPAYLKRYSLYTLPYRRRLIERLKRLQPGLTILDVRLQLARLRSIKQPEELQAIQAAIDITTATLTEITTSETLARAEHEYQLEAAITYGFRSRGAVGHAFTPIVGAGVHSTTLHHEQNDGVVMSEDLIVVDIGAEVEHYAADITRTISKQPITGRKAAVWRAVALVQDYALSLLKPGVSYREYELAVEAKMGEALKSLKLINKPDQAAIRHYFPTATSHFLGLNTHDAGDYSAPLEAGMVLTCEPGIYIPEEGIGVRLEDDILITPTGNRSLSAACPRELTPVQ